MYVRLRNSSGAALHEVASPAPGLCTIGLFVLWKRAFVGKCDHLGRPRPRQHWADIVEPFRKSDAGGGHTSPNGGRASESSRDGGACEPRLFIPTSHQQPCTQIIAKYPGSLQSNGSHQPSEIGSHAHLEAAEA